MLLNSTHFKADTVIYDLEDSIQPSSNYARIALKNLTLFLRGELGSHPPPPSAVKEIAVRIPATSSPHTYFKAFQNFDEWFSPRFKQPDTPTADRRRQCLTFVVPKVTCAFDVELAARAVHHVFPKNWSSVSLVLMIENPRAVMNLAEITAVTRDTGLVNGLMFGAEDFCTSLSIMRSDSLLELSYARSAIVTAARAADIPSIIDLVTIEHTGSAEDLEKLRRETLMAKQMGFTGKQVIHPNQVELVESTLCPDQEQLDWARRVVDGWALAREKDTGSFPMRGQMMDRPMVTRAHSILEYAALCGLSVPRPSAMTRQQEEARKAKQAKMLAQNLERKEKRAAAREAKAQEAAAAVGEGAAGETAAAGAAVAQPVGGDQAETTSTPSDDMAEKENKKPEETTTTTTTMATLAETTNGPDATTPATPADKVAKAPPDAHTPESTAPSESQEKAGSRGS